MKQLNVKWGQHFASKSFLGSGACTRSHPIWLIWDFIFNKNVSDPSQLRQLWASLSSVRGAINGADFGWITSPTFQNHSQLTRREPENGAKTVGGFKKFWGPPLALSLPTKLGLLKACLSWGQLPSTWVPLPMLLSTRVSLRRADLNTWQSKA